MRVNRLAPPESFRLASTVPDICGMQKEKSFQPAEKNAKIQARRLLGQAVIKLAVLQLVIVPGLSDVVIADELLGEIDVGRPGSILCDKCVRLCVVDKSSHACGKAL